MHLYNVRSNTIMLCPFSRFVFDGIHCLIVVLRLRLDRPSSSSIISCCLPTCRCSRVATRAAASTFVRILYASLYCLLLFDDMHYLIVVLRLRLDRPSSSSTISVLYMPRCIVLLLYMQRMLISFPHPTVCFPRLLVDITENLRTYMNWWESVYRSEVGLLTNNMRN